MVRKIIHFDLDAFYCAVEEQRHAELRGLPFAVGGRPESRGVVSSCSYAARRFGVRSAMGMAQAVRLCPQLQILPADMREYALVSKRVMEILHGMTPQVEQLSIDEAFLDVSGRSEYATALARALQAQVEESLGLPSSLGVATNKLVAKIATDVGKAASSSGDYPRAIQVVPPQREAEFLAPLPVEALWGVGPRTRERLAAVGILTVGDVVAASSDELGRRFGKLGHDLHRQAQGIDLRPVVTARGGEVDQPGDDFRARCIGYGDAASGAAPAGRRSGRATPTQWIGGAYGHAQGSLVRFHDAHAPGHSGATCA